MRGTKAIHTSIVERTLDGSQTNRVLNSQPQAINSEEAINSEGANVTNNVLGKVTVDSEKVAGEIRFLKW